MLGAAATRTCDPNEVYRDALIALAPARGINNGQPSLWAAMFERLAVRPGERVLHLGCGGGYYSAILAELVGPGGFVRAFEIEPRLAALARRALAPWPWVRVRRADAARDVFAPADLPADILLASAGATHPLPAWLDAIAPGGRLLLPLTDSLDQGAMLLLTRGENGFSARFLQRVAFIPFRGARDAETARDLAAALRRDGGASVRSLRRDPHPAAADCWLHRPDVCLSTRGAESD